MEYKNILNIDNRNDFRTWLMEHYHSEKECWVVAKRGKPQENQLNYLDAVEEALCFGWIDSTYGLVNGIRMQRFSPRTKKSNWTELNKERVKRLDKLGLMTEDGLKIVPKEEFVFDEELVKLMKENEVWEIFTSFPPLYQRIRFSNLLSTMNYSKDAFEKLFENFIKKTKEHQMYGEWNDYGRLLNY